MTWSRRAILVAAASSMAGAAPEGLPASQIVPTATPVSADDDVIRQVSELVHEKFFDGSRLPLFDAAVEAYRRDAKERFDTHQAIRRGLAALGASHTELFTPDELDYYELIDIYLAALNAKGYAAELTAIFPPDGLPRYDGIGMAMQNAPEGWYVSAIYDGSPASKAGLAVGDVVLEADGAPFAPIGSFAGKAGHPIKLTVLRAPGSGKRTVQVRAETIRPNALTDAAIKASVKTFFVGGKEIGYLHLWTYSTPDIQDVVEQILSNAPLRDVAGLVLDLRCRHGGAPPQAADTFVGVTPELEMVGRSSRFVANFRYRKPLVALIDGGTRSGMEMLAYALKKAGVVLVGTRTAGAMLGGMPFLLKDKSFLSLAVMSAKVDGQVLEGKGVRPTVEIPYTKLFSGGVDPQLSRASDELAGALRSG